MEQTPLIDGPEPAEAAERARRRRLLLLTLLLLVGLPIYITAAAFLVAWINPVVTSATGESARALPWFVEILIYGALGLLWALPLKRLTLGLGRSASTGGGPRGGASPS